MKDPECLLRWLLMFFSPSSGRTKYILNDGLSELWPYFTSFSVLRLPPSLRPPPPSSSPPPPSCSHSRVPLLTYTHALSERRCLHRGDVKSFSRSPYLWVQFSSSPGSKVEGGRLCSDTTSGQWRETPAFLKPHRALHQFHFIFWWYRPYLFYSLVNILGLV